MSRETQRQIDRLRRLANFISANPDEYSQADHENCVIGLGLRLKRNKLQSSDILRETGTCDDMLLMFGKKFGLDSQTVEHIYTNKFGFVLSNYENLGGWDTRNPINASQFLLDLADLKTLDKAI